MSRPPPGNYYIINRVLDPAGEKLALSSNGQDKDVSVTPLANSPNQIWTIQNYNSTTMSVSPQNATNLQIGMGSGVITVLSAGGYVWTIKSTDSGYTIQDGGVTVYWGLNKAVIGEDVNFGAGTNTDRQRWVFVPAK